MSYDPYKSTILGRHAMCEFSLPSYKLLHALAETATKGRDEQNSRRGSYRYDISIKQRRLERASSASDSSDFHALPGSPYRVCAVFLGIMKLNLSAEKEEKSSVSALLSCDRA